MAALPPEALAAALSAAHSAGAKGAAAPTAGADPSQAGADPNADPAQGGADPNADPSQSGADPQHQALWQLFPSTDPNYLQTLISQGGDPQDAIGQMVQQGESDLSQFKQMQDALFMHLAALFGAPSGGGLDQGAPPPQSPGVGGQGAGY